MASVEDPARPKRQYNAVNRKAVNTVHFQVRISPELKRRLLARAEATGQRVTEVARDMMIDGLDAQAERDERLVTGRSPAAPA